MYRIEISNPHSKPPLKWSKAPDLEHAKAECATAEEAHYTEQQWTARGYMVRIKG